MAISSPASFSLSPNPTSSSNFKFKPLFSLSSPPSLKSPLTSPSKSTALQPIRFTRHSPLPCLARRATSATDNPTTTTSTTFHGLCYVVGDNIDTDQIIPAEYLTLVPSVPAEYEKLGSYALIGLPASYTPRFIDPEETKTKYSILIGGYNFGCGSSREHAPVALGAAGVKAVVAESYARIFFRNSVATGEVYPVESEARICEECRTGDLVTVELGEAENKLINHTTGKEYRLKPIGDAGPVIEAGGIFAYARKTGMIPN